MKPEKRCTFWILPRARLRADVFRQPQRGQSAARRGDKPLQDTLTSPPTSASGVANRPGMPNQTCPKCDSFFIGPARNSEIIVRILRRIRTIISLSLAGPIKKLLAVAFRTGLILANAPSRGGATQRTQNDRTGRAAAPSILPRPRRALDKLSSGGKNDATRST